MIFYNNADKFIDEILIILMIMIYKESVKNFFVDYYHIKNKDCDDKSELLEYILSKQNIIDNIKI